MFAAKEYRQGADVLVAACDEDLLDSSHREGRFHLQVPSSFYDGDRMDQQSLARMLSRCSIANLVGARTIEVAVELGIVDRDNVLEVGGVPHAQFLVLEP